MKITYLNENNQYVIKIYLPIMITKEVKLFIQKKIPKVLEDIKEQMEIDKELSKYFQGLSKQVYDLKDENLKLRKL